MSTSEASNHRLKGRLLTPKNQHKVSIGGRLPRRDVKNEGRTDYVYENKGMDDKMSCIWESYFANLPLNFPILQISRGQSVVNCISRLVEPPFRAALARPSFFPPLARERHVILFEPPLGRHLPG